MPYDNAYNGAVAGKVRKINQARVSTENVINDNLQPNDPVTSQVESMALKHPEVEGGGGYAAATLGDMGFEPTLGADGSAKPKKARKKKGEGIAGAGLGAGLAAAGLAAAGASGAGASGGKKRCKKDGGALLSLQDIVKMHGQPPLEMNAKMPVQAKPHNVALMGGAREVGVAAGSAPRKTQRSCEGDHEGEGNVATRSQQAHKGEQLVLTNK